MAEEVNIKINVDSSGAEKSVNKVKKSTSKIKGNLKGSKKEASGFGNIMKGGAVLGAIGLAVGLLGKMKDTLMNNATVANFVGKNMAGLNAVVSNTVDKLVSGFTAWTDKVKEQGLWKTLGDNVKDYGKAVKQNLINRVEGFGESVSKIGGWIKAKWQGNTEEATKAMEGFGNSLLKAHTGIDTNNEAFKEQARELQRIKKLGEDVYDRQRKQVVAAANLNLEQSRNLKTINEQRAISKDLNLSYQERINALKKADELEQSTLQKQITYKKEQLNILILNSQIAKNTEEDDAAILNARADIAKAEAKYQATRIRSISQLSALEQKQLKERLSAEDTLSQLKIDNITNEEQRAVAQIEKERVDFENEIAQMEIDNELKQELIKENQRNVNIAKEEINAEYRNNEAEAEKEKLDKERAAKEAEAERVKEEAKAEAEYKIIQQKEETDARIEGFNRAELASNLSFGTMSNFRRAQMTEDLKMAEGNSKKQEQIRRKFARQEAEQSLIENTINGALAIGKAIASLGPIAGPIAVATTVVPAIISAANNIRSSISQFADGGLVEGPGSDRSDSISARLSNGESVINARSTRMFRNELSEMNYAGGGVRFAEGGIAGQSGSLNNGYGGLRDEIIGAIRSIPVQVSAVDISSTQKAISVVQSNSQL